MQDSESGWSALHRAFHFGHWAAAGLLMAAGASLALHDTKGRTPLELIVAFRQDTSSSGEAGLRGLWPLSRSLLIVGCREFVQEPEGLDCVLLPFACSFSISPQ